MTPKTHYMFVDTVRFWSMLAVVAMHTSVALSMFVGSQSRLLQALVSFFKFGTIGFFLISGFLLGDRLETCRPVDYLMRRVRKVLFPWLFWFALLVTFVSMGDRFHHRLFFNSAWGSIESICREAAACAFSTAFWFVPNLLLALSVLLLFRRYLNSLTFGAILFAVNLFYVLNIYGQWFPSKHSQALFAFVSYLWLGSYCARHFEALNERLARVRMHVLLALSALALVAAYAETRLLQTLHSPDPLNSLRLSNQLFSILVVLVLLRLRRRSWPKFVDVRAQTFGLYLTHSMVLSGCFDVLRRILRDRPEYLAGHSAVMGTAAWAILFVVTYSSCLLLTRVISGVSALRWSVGLEAAEIRSPKPVRTNALELPSLGPLQS